MYKSTPINTPIKNLSRQHFINSFAVSEVPGQTLNYIQKYIIVD